ncbi:MAG: hypothetical protein U9P81_04905, partial [Euryarchaeota archaeon]|nr:hypothetical protein [Euryarchaeota archaeon]
MMKTYATIVDSVGIYKVAGGKNIIHSNLYPNHRVIIEIQMRRKKNEKFENYNMFYGALYVHWSYASGKCNGMR